MTDNVTPLVPPTTASTNKQAVPPTSKARRAKATTTSKESRL